jgi:hypothetical protein
VFSVQLVAERVDKFLSFFLLSTFYIYYNKNFQTLQQCSLYRKNFFRLIFNKIYVIIVGGEISGLL